MYPEPPPSEHMSYNAEAAGKRAAAHLSPSYGEAYVQREEAPAAGLSIASPQYNVSLVGGAAFS